VSVALSAALVPPLGAKGASIASAVCEFVVAGGYLLALTRSHVRLRPSFALLPRAVLAAGVGACALLLPWPNVAQWAVASVAYLGLLLLLRAFPEGAAAPDPAAPPLRARTPRRSS